MPRTEKFDIRNRWTGEVQFTAEITCAADALPSIKLGLAIKAGIKADANLAGADLADANLADADLTGANLAGANLTGANLAGADLTGADLAGANLTGADLAGAYLADANLARANLAGANLADAYLADADWIPRIPNIHGAIYEAASKPRALDMSSWHNDGYCGTTHCRAGWTVVLAGEGGKVLEGVMGTSAAAALIYAASDPKLDRVPNWLASNADALADMKALAEAEIASAQA